LEEEAGTAGLVAVAAAVSVYAAAAVVEVEDIRRVLMDTETQETLDCSHFPLEVQCCRREDTDTEVAAG
jgi:hypothetical protein